MHVRTYAAISLPTLAALVVLAASAPAAHGGVATPHLLPLQGKATDGAGELIATGDLAVRIYDAATAGSLIYDSGTEFVGSIDEGLFDCLLGASATLELDNTQLYYLEVDSDGYEVIGDANGGRIAFYPGGGSHDRIDLENRLAALETELGISRPAETPNDTSPGAGTRFSGSSAGYQLRHGLLGTGVAQGASATYGLTANILLQPAGPYEETSRHLYLGPYYLGPEEAQQVPAGESPGPIAFRLYPCSPNPFNTATQIRFDLPVAERIRAHVLAVDGRLVATVCDRVMPAGRYQMAWSGRDNRGARVSSGVYLLRFRRASGEETGRMIFLE